MLCSEQVAPVTYGGCDAVLGRESLHVLGCRFAFWVQRGPEFGELPGVPAFSNESAISASRW